MHYFVVWPYYVIRIILNVNYKIKYYSPSPFIVVQSPNRTILTKEAIDWFIHLNIQQKGSKSLRICALHSNEYLQMSYKNLIEL